MAGIAYTNSRTSRDSHMGNRKRPLVGPILHTSSHSAKEAPMPKIREAEFEVVRPRRTKPMLARLVYTALVVSAVVACIACIEWGKIPLLLDYRWFAFDWFLFALVVAAIFLEALIKIVAFVFETTTSKNAYWVVSDALIATFAWLAFMTHVSECALPAFHDSQGNVVVFTPDDVPYTAGGKVVDRIKKVDDAVYLKNDANDLLVLVPLPVQTGRFAKVDMAAKERFAIAGAADLSAKLVRERPSPGGKPVLEKR